MFAFAMSIHLLMSTILSHPFILFMRLRSELLRTIIMVFGRECNSARRKGKMAGALAKRGGLLYNGM
jgi:hypothetical protein